MEDILIEVNNLSKKFSKDLKTSLKYGFIDAFKEIVGRKKSMELRPTEFWAVSDISFKVKRGESLALIGHNGAGKSTLLKMLNGLIKPDKGNIIMRGKIGALIELGAGFNPVLTGRENIFINASILGFSKIKIEEKFKSIIEFSEIGEFIDTPVQNYSSGMKVRLGFAIAAQMEPDILIIDEVLAVGDTGFKIKCFNRIAELKEKCALIFVSHSMPQIGRICNKAIFMVKGEKKYDGENLTEAVESYYNSFSTLKTGLTDGNKSVNITKLLINNSETIPEVAYNNDLEILINFNNISGRRLNSLICIVIDNDYKSVASSIHSFGHDEDFIEVEMRFILPNIQLGIGTYYLTFQFFEDIGTDNRGAILEHCSNVGQFKMLDSPCITAAAFQLLNEVEILNCK